MESRFSSRLHQKGSVYVILQYYILNTDGAFLYASNQYCSLYVN